jgi:hypothetical protein
MPANKKHHYVPRFYLKRFAPDGRSVNLYNFRLARAITKTNLKNQCYRDYMYGKDGGHEQRLAVLEGAFAQLLRNMLPSCFLPPAMSPDHESLCILTLLQYARTAYSSDAMDEMADGMWKAVLSHDSRISPDMLEKVRIVNKDPANFTVAMMLRLYHLIMDLQYRLLLAKPGTEFITSDNPVVMYNQLMEFERLGSSTGLASKGLQIFFPLSPAHMLHFYDPEVYACEPRRSLATVVSTVQDMDQLNALQVVSALENVYYSGHTSNVFRAVEIGMKRRRPRKASIFKGPEKTTATGGSQLIGSSRVDVRTNLDLSFVRLLKPAKRWREERKKPGPKRVSVVRNEWLLKEHEKFSELVDMGQYQPTEFLRYLEHVR